jgi:hypothetical protein
MNEDGATGGGRPARIAAAVGLTLGAVLVIAGWLVRPVAMSKHLQVTEIEAIGHAADAFVMSFRLLVFGLFVRLSGLSALVLVATRPSTRALLVPAIAMCAGALLMSALGEAYQMDIGVHSVWRFGQEADPAAREAILTSFLPTAEWADCCRRMGAMFLGFGSIVVGIALWGGDVMSRWIGVVLAVIGATGMFLLFADATRAAYYTFAFIGLAGMHGVMGAALLLRRPPAASGKV